jgi:diguanylate cyclase (GGDEF)-like protein/PAS domain S-box-containing protein
VTVNDNEPASVDALTAQGGFLADVGMAGTDAIADLAQRHRELEARYRGIIDRLPAVLYIDGVHDGDTMVDIGPGIVDLLGLTREEWLARSEGWRDVVHPDDLDRIVEASERTASTGEPFREQYRAIHRDGREVWIREEAIRVEDDDGNPQFWLGLMLDITDSVRMERELVEAQTKYGALVEHIPAIVYVDLADEQMTTTYVSPQIEALLGITPAEYIDDPDLWLRHLHPEDRDETVTAYVDGRDAGEPFTLEYRLIARDGRVLWFSDSAVVVHTPTGEPLYVQGVMLDITKRKEAEEHIAFLAYHDELTGLPNRVLFDELLDLSLTRARRHGLGVSVISVDIDNFKLVNDSLGHEAGDELIILLAERLREATRETDLVARPGGDEFLMLLADLELTSAVRVVGDPAALVAESVASRIQAALRQPFEVAGTELYVTASLGISLFPSHGDDPKTLLRHADNAMFRSKQMGPGGSFLHAASDVDAMGKLSLSTRLRKAVENQTWMLHYQPLIDLSTGGMIGVEALIRWPEPGGGLIQPGEFIPLAEEMGLIEAIGDWVVEELSRQDALWRADGLALEISFNLSPRQLWQPDVVEKI